MSLKIDLKTGLIIILLAFCVIFFSLWYLKGAGSGQKREYKKLENEYKMIQKSRDSLAIINLDLKKKFLDSQKEIESREKLIKLVQSQLRLSEEDLIRSKSEVESMRKDLDKTKRKIEDLKRNPIKREDDNLIESLKEKLK